jgi:outer membrane biosynthesis protein TonB
MDWTLVYLLMLSFVFQGGAGIGLDIWWRVEGQYLEDPLKARANQRYQLLRSMAKDKEEEEEKKKEEEKEEEKDSEEEDSEETKVEEPKEKVRKVIRKKQPSGKSDLKSIDRNISKKTVMGVLTAIGGEGSEVADMLAKGVKDLEGAFDGATIDTDASAELNGGFVGPDPTTKNSETLKNITRKTGPLTKTKTFDRTKRGPEIKVSVRNSAVSGKGGMGDIDAGEVTKRIRRRSSAVKACYERALRANPKLKGKLAIRFTITNSGRVGANVKVRTNQTNSAVSSCIISKLKNWRFPQPKKGTVSFNYTWVFSGR